MWEIIFVRKMETIDYLFLAVMTLSLFSALHVALVSCRWARVATGDMGPAK